MPIPLVQDATYDTSDEMPVIDEDDNLSSNSDSVVDELLGIDEDDSLSWISDSVLDEDITPPTSPEPETEAMPMPVITGYVPGFFYQGVVEQIRLNGEACLPDDPRWHCRPVNQASQQSTEMNREPVSPPSTRPQAATETQSNAVMAPASRQQMREAMVVSRQEQIWNYPEYIGGQAELERLRMAVRASHQLSVARSGGEVGLSRQTQDQSAMLPEQPVRILAPTPFWRHDTPGSTTEGNDAGQHRDIPCYCEYCGHLRRECVCGRYRLPWAPRVRLSRDASLD